MMKGTLLLYFVITLLCLNESKGETVENRPAAKSNSNRSFVIDYNNNVFLKDGEPFTFISGELHYFRIPRVYWQDRLRKCTAAGLNTVSIYIEWSTHEPSPGKYNFEGEADIEYFLQEAKKENLLVILRPGPFISAEREFGGLPSWLLTLYPNITLRSHDPDFEYEVEKWFAELFGRIGKYLYGEGGPIITVQVENEYGMYPNVWNKDYKLFIRDLFRKHVDNKAVLFTTDSPLIIMDGCNRTSFEYGMIPEVFATINFPVGERTRLMFSEMRKFSPRGPLVNSEFYTGWFSLWGPEDFNKATRHSVDTTAIIRNKTKESFSLGANINFFLFAGGTNFGFKNGAKFEVPLLGPRYVPNGKYVYKPISTSFNWGAPIDEAGDYTQMYFGLRNFISEYYNKTLPDPPAPSPKGKYGKVRLESVLSVFNTVLIGDKIEAFARVPKTFEQLKVSYGYVLYETKVPDNMVEQAELLVKEVRDRAIISLNQVPVGILSRREENYTISLSAASGKTLSILIENQGRVSDGAYLKDNFKGLLSTPTLDGKPLENWNMTGLPFENISWVHNLPKPTEEIKPPALYVGELILPPNEQPKDTFVDLTGWGKGVIFINDFNIGRYWPSVGPQVTLYVPGCYLRANPQKNTIVVFETDYVPENKEIIFKDKAILEKPKQFHGK